MRSRSFGIVCLGLVLSTWPLLGCGASDGRLQVTGSVKFDDGTPAKGATAAVVRFEPEDPNAPNARAATGYVDGETGEFSLYSVKPGDGANPGKYKVTLIVNSMYPPRPAGVMVPEEYTSAATTPLTEEISSSKRRFEFTVPKRKSKADGAKKKR
jgi:hypothetical protein